LGLKDFVIPSEDLIMALFNISRTIAGRIAARVFALLILLAVGASAQTDLKEKYPKMAPLDQYLMNNRDAEIALARSAAPEAISKDATVLVLTPTGWETAIKGTNGFVCMVDRGWTGVIDFPEIWNPKLKGAVCYNPAAVRTILPIEYVITKMTLAGVYSVKERIARIQVAYAKKELPPVEPGAMGFMMSKQSYLTDNGTNLCHLMPIVATRKTDSEWGAWLPHVPIGSASYWFPNPGTESPLEKDLPPLRSLYITVPRWSDGTSILAK
jgi:hypothetical protein